MSWKLALAPFVTCSLLAGAAGIASAGDDVNALKEKLVRYSSAVYYAEKDGASALSRFDQPAADCFATVAALKRAGMNPDESIYDLRNLTFRGADAECKAYQQWKPLLGALEVLEKSAQTLGIVRGFKPGDASVEWADGAEKDAKTCEEAIDKAIADGAPADKPIKVAYGVTVTLTEARTQVCKALFDWAEPYRKATKQKKADDASAAAGRYKKFGAAGDKLEWLTYYDPDGTGSTWYVPPSCKGVDDPKALAKAKVLIRWTVDDDGTQHLRRLQFKGNKLVKDTERSFLTEAAAYRGCK